MADARARAHYNPNLPRGCDHAWVALELALGSEAAASSVLRVRTPRMIRLSSLELVGSSEPGRVLQGLAETDHVVSYALADVPCGTSRLLLRFDFDAYDQGDRARLANIELTSTEAGAEPVRLDVIVEWSDEIEKTVVPDPVVAECMGRAELAKAVSEAVDASQDDDAATATTLLTAAARLASETGEESLRIMLEQLISETELSRKTEVTRLNTGPSTSKGGG